MIKLSTRWASSAHVRTRRSAAGGRGMRRALASLALVGTQVGTLAGCAVGPDFLAPNAPNVSNYLPGRGDGSTISGQGITR